MKIYIQKKQIALVTFLSAAITSIFYKSISLDLFDLIHNNSSSMTVSIIDIYYKFFLIPIKTSNVDIEELFKYDFFDLSRITIILTLCISIIVSTQSTYMNKQRYFVMNRYRSVKRLLNTHLINSFIIASVYMLVCMVVIFTCFLLDTSVSNKNIYESIYLDIYLTKKELLFWIVCFYIKQIIILLCIGSISVLIVNLFNDFLAFLNSLIIINLVYIAQIGLNVNILTFCKDINCNRSILIMSLILIMIYIVSNRTLKKLDF